jgi:hypothetical protein
LTKITPIIQILFYNFLICTLLTGIFLPLGWQSFDREMLFLLIGVGVFGAVCFGLSGDGGGWGFVV